MATLRSMNKVILLGNLTRDPELSYTPSGTAIAKLGMAVNRRFKSQGEWKEETTFVDVDVWGKQAETVSEYMKKGKGIYVEGRLRLDQWETKDGDKRSKLKVTADRFEFADDPKRAAGAEGFDSGNEEAPFH